MDQCRGLAVVAPVPVPGTSVLGVACCLMPRASSAYPTNVCNLVKPRGALGRGITRYGVRLPLDEIPRLHAIAIQACKEQLRSAAAKELGRQSGQGGKCRAAKLRRSASE